MGFCDLLFRDPILAAAIMSVKIGGFEITRFRLRLAKRAILDPGAIEFSGKNGEFSWWFFRDFDLLVFCGKITILRGLKCSLIVQYQQRIVLPMAWSGDKMEETVFLGSAFPGSYSRGSNHECKNRRV